MATITRTMTALFAAAMMTATSGAAMAEPTSKQGPQPSSRMRHDWQQAQHRRSVKQNCWIEQVHHKTPSGWKLERVQHCSSHGVTGAVEAPR